MTLERASRASSTRAAYLVGVRVRVRVGITNPNPNPNPNHTPNPNPNRNPTPNPTPNPHLVVVQRAVEQLGAHRLLGAEQATACEAGHLHLAQPTRRADLRDRLLDAGLGSIRVMVGLGWELG